MKKVIPVLLLPLLFGVSQAESMKFVTVLSSPVGSFNKLEAVDPKTPAKGSTVNFCTKVGSSGEVQLKGTSAANLKEVVLSSNTTLGKTDSGKYSLTDIKLHKDGNLKGGRLLADELKIAGDTVGISAHLYGETLTVEGGKAPGIIMGGNKAVMTGSVDTAPTMEWSNLYQADSACGSDCPKQYLLKSSGGVVVDTPQEEELVTCFTRIDWRSELRNIKEEAAWQFWGEKSTITGKDAYGQWDQGGLYVTSYWYDSVPDCQRCTGGGYCRCTPGSWYRLDTSLAKIVKDKQHVSQLEGWHAGLCEKTTVDKCLSWEGLLPAMGSVAWKRSGGVVPAATAGGGTVKNYEREVTGTEMGVIPPDETYFRYCSVYKE